MTLIVEMGRDDLGWTTLGTMRPGDREGSLSDNSDGRRDILRFRTTPDCSIVEMSRAGVDVEVGVHRAIVATGFDVLARLRDGESYERPVQTDRMSQPVQVRFRHHTDTDQPTEGGKEA